MDENDDKNKIRRLLQIRRNITNCLRDNREELNHIRNVRTVHARDIIDLADYASKTLKAPPLWKPGNPVIGGHPPAPQPEQMRLGKLGEHHLHLETMKTHDADRLMQPIQAEQNTLLSKNSKSVNVTETNTNSIVEFSETMIVLESLNEEERHPTKKARVISVNFDEMSSDSD